MISAAAHKRKTHALGTAFSPHVGLNWQAVLNDPCQPLVITNNAAKAAQLCAAGQPAIAVLGISEADLTAWLRARGANVRTKAEAH